MLTRPAVPRLRSSGRKTMAASLTGAFWKVNMEEACAAESRLIVALDTSDVQKAIAMAGLLKEHAAYLKVGLRLYLAGGPGVIQALRDMGAKVFLDLKFHDIPSQVAAGCRQAINMGAQMLTVHVSGGRAMLEAAMEATKQASSEFQSQQPLLLGVTLLTSLSENEVKTLYGADIHHVLRDQIALAQNVGLPGLVASPLELREIREMVGGGPVLVTPGIRPEGSQVGDQERFLTPEAAVERGADYLVVGRPVIEAPDPIEACRSIHDSIAESARDS